jgi:hypothetical protein
MGTSGQLCEGCFPKLSLSTRHVGDIYEREDEITASASKVVELKKPGQR